MKNYNEMKELKKLLLDYGFYCDDEYMEEIIKYKTIELVQKSYGDSHEIPVSDVFGKDYKRFMKLLNKFNIECPDFVWYD